MVSKQALQVHVSLCLRAGRQLWNVPICFVPYSRLVPTQQSFKSINHTFINSQDWSGLYFPKLQFSVCLFVLTRNINDSQYKSIHLYFYIWNNFSPSYTALAKSFVWPWNFQNVMNRIHFLWEELLGMAEYNNVA